MRGTRLHGDTVRIRHCNLGAICGSGAGTRRRAAHGWQEHRSLRTRVACQLARAARSAKAVHQSTAARAPVRAAEARWRRQQQARVQTPGEEARVRAWATLSVTSARASNAEASPTSAFNAKTCGAVPR